MKQTFNVIDDSRYAVVWNNQFLVKLNKATPSKSVWSTDLSKAKPFCVSVVHTVLPLFKGSQEARLYTEITAVIYGK